MDVFVDALVAFLTDRLHYSLKKKRIQVCKTSASYHFFIRIYAASYFHGVLERHRTQKMKKDLYSAHFRDIPSCGRELTAAKLGQSSPLHRICP